MTSPDDIAEPEPRLSEAEAVALFEESNARYSSGDLASAEHGYERLIASGLLAEWGHFSLGRLRRDRADEDAAMASFEAAIALDPRFFWAHYERLILSRDLGAPVSTLADNAAALVAAPPEALADGHVAHLEPLAHRLWDEGHRDAGRGLLQRLWPARSISQLGLVRLVEAAGDGTVVDAAAKRLESAPDLDDAALRVLADLHQQHGDLDREIAILEKRRAAAPRDFQTWLGLVRSYAKKQDRAATERAVADGAGFPDRQRSFVALIAELELGDVEAAFHAYRGHARLWGEAPKFPGIRLAYLLGDRFDTTRRNEVLGLLVAHFGDDPDIALVRVNSAMRDQKWDEARDLFERFFPDIEGKPQSVRLAKVDILAYSGRLEEAAALLERERVDGHTPPAFLRSTLRILSELERWDDAFAIGLPEIGEDASFEHFLSVMVRASRKTGRGRELLDALVALPRPLKRPHQEAMFAVMEDLAEAGDASVLDRAGDVAIPYEREHRMRLKLRALTGATPVAKDLCIYYCADATYLTPALVSLTALAMSNVSITRRASFRIVVDADVVPVATASAAAIGERLGLDVSVVDASTIVSSADRLRTGYGIFTGGQQLALAAYYRIFYARHLVEQGGFDQALYVDADTVVRGGLDELFEADRRAPLMARYETDRPEVRHAAQVHRLKGRYFNSGVLRFDLANPALPGLLDHAIAAAIDPDVNLIFQDQCALNIAFDQNMTELPERFNYFNPPTVSGDGVAATDAVIVHYLDRPKPWDSLYRRRAREWFEWFDLVETLRRRDAML